MSRYEHIKIFQCSYILTLEIYKITKNFSREYKYTLGEKLKNAAHDLLDSVMRANALTDRKKAEYLPVIDFKKETIRIYFRLAHDLDLVSAGRLGDINRRIEEIGRQLGGWQKWTSKREA